MPRYPTDMPSQHVDDDEALLDPYHWPGNETEPDEVDLSVDLSSDPVFDFEAAGWRLGDDGYLIPPR